MRGLLDLAGLAAGDLQDIEVKALEEGMSFQTLIAGVVHK
jgi:predicted DNA binding CopG/RHH family protein